MGASESGTLRLISCFWVAQRCAVRILLSLFTLTPYLLFPACATQKRLPKSSTRKPFYQIAAAAVSPKCRRPKGSQ